MKDNPCFNDYKCYLVNVYIYSQNYIQGVLELNLKEVKTFKLGFTIITLDCRKKKFPLLEILNLYQPQGPPPFLKSPQ